MTEKNNNFTHKDSVSLRDYFDNKIDGLEDKINLQFQAQATALTKAEAKNDARLEGMNEFRAAMKDQAASFITRAEMNLKFQAEDKSRRDNIALGISLIAIALSIITKII